MSRKPCSSAARSGWSDVEKSLRLMAAGRNSPTPIARQETSVERNWNQLETETPQVLQHTQNEQDLRGLRRLLLFQYQRQIDIGVHIDR